METTCDRTIDILYIIISIEEMKKRVRENDKLVLLDVRTEKEYNAAHII